MHVAKEERAWSVKKFDSQNGFKSLSSFRGVLSLVFCIKLARVIDYNTGNLAEFSCCCC